MVCSSPGQNVWLEFKSHGRASWPTTAPALHAGGFGAGMRAALMTWNALLPQTLAVSSSSNGAQCTCLPFSPLWGVLFRDRHSSIWYWYNFYVFFVIFHQHTNVFHSCKNRVLIMSYPPLVSSPGTHISVRPLGIVPQVSEALSLSSTFFSLWPGWSLRVTLSHPSTVSLSSPPGPCPLTAVPSCLLCPHPGCPSSTLPFMLLDPYHLCSFFFFSLHVFFLVFALVDNSCHWNDHYAEFNQVYFPCSVLR